MFICLLKWIVGSYVEIGVKDVALATRYYCAS